MPLSFRPLRILNVVAAALLAVTMSGCGDGGGGGSKVVIGTKFDQPGLSLRAPDGSMSGFDVDVARFVAQQLGYGEDQIEWTEAQTAKRESLIASEPGGRLACGGVTCATPNFIVGSYSITDVRKEKVNFAGPYLTTGQSLLVRADEARISGPESLSQGQKVCTVDGSTSARRMRDEYPTVQLEVKEIYSDCVAALRSGEVDAVTTDEVILAGFAAQAPGVFKLVGKPFSEERYGIGMKQGDDDLRTRINDALRKMEADGAWKAAFEKNLGPAGLATPAPPPIDQ